MVATIAVVAVMLLSFRRVVDDDLWLHLRLGDEIRAGERFGRTDPLTVLADRPYVPTQWLAEVVASLTYEATGLGGIHLMRLLAVAAVSMSIYYAVRTVTGPMRAAAVTLPTLFATSAAWAERPQLAGLVLHSVVILIWVRAYRSGGVPWLVVPLTWLWACLHGTWSLGIVTGAVLTSAMAMDARTRKQWKGNSAVVCLSILVVCATPLGPTLLLQPFAVSEAARASVSEWQTPSFGNPTFLAVLLMAVVGGAAVVLRRRGSWVGVGMLGLGIGLASYSVRTVAFGAVVVGLGLAVSVSANRRVSLPPRQDEARLWLAASMAIVLGGILWARPAAELTDHELRAELARISPGTNIAVQPDVSGWVLFHEPALRPLRDLRAEAYSREAAERFTAIWMARTGWESELALLDTPAVLIRSDELLSKALGSGSWTRVAVGDGYELWTSPAGVGTRPA